MKKWIGYTCYVIAALVVFIYLLFPSQEIKQYMLQQSAALGPDVSVELDRVDLNLPPGLVFTNLKLFFQGSAAFDSSQLKLTPRYVSLFSSAKALNIKGKAYNGDLNGRASVENASKPIYATDLAFEDIQLDKIAILSELVPHQVSGIAEGKVVYSSGSESFGEGNARLMIKQCRVELGAPIFGFTELSVGTLKATLELKGRQANVQEITIDGRQVSGNASGEIRLRQPLSESRIQLSGVIKPRPSFIKELGKVVPSQLLSGGNFVRNGVPFRISGSVERPNFSLR